MPTTPGKYAWNGKCIPAEEHRQYNETEATPNEFEWHVDGEPNEDDGYNT